MRIAIITDIHEDHVMLEEAIKKLKGVGYDLLVCLGDITGYAPKYHNHTPNVNACIDMLSHEAHVVLAGNHDLFSAQLLPSYHIEKNIPTNWYELSLKERFNISNNTLWLYEEEIMPNLTPKSKFFLEGLAERYILDTGKKRVMFSHFLQPDLAGVSRWFPYRIGELKPHFMYMNEHNSTISFVGHCHPEGVTVVSKLFWSIPYFEGVLVSNKPRIVLCPAIVSGGRSSSCIMYDTETNIIMPYPLQ